MSASEVTCTLKTRQKEPATVYQGTLSLAGVEANFRLQCSTRVPDGTLVYPEEREAVLNGATLEVTRSDGSEIRLPDAINSILRRGAVAAALHHRQSASFGASQDVCTPDTIDCLFANNLETTGEIRIPAGPDLDSFVECIKQS